MRSPLDVRLIPLLIAAACTGGSDTSETDTSETDTNETDIQPLPVGLQWFDAIRPEDVTPDGRTVLVSDQTSLDAAVLFLDTATGAQREATTLGDVTRNLATGMSANLEISALHGDPVEAGVWSEADGWTDLPSPYTSGCEQDHGGSWDISDDGAVVVGLMWDACSPVAFRWTAVGGVAPLEILGEGGAPQPTNRASVVSGDGQVAAGFAASGPLDRTPASWSASGQGTLLDPTTVDAPGEVLSINFDGSVLAGQSGGNGFVWTAADGLVDLGRPEAAMPADPVYPNAMTAEGTAVFGAVGSDFFTVPIAFVWTPSGGSRAIGPLVEAAGIEVPEGWLLTNVLAASADGSVLAGMGYDADFAPKAFVLTIDPAAWAP